MQIDLSKIKLIIWDLDDTFWYGTLSEGEITPNKQNISLVKDLADVGIVSTICSKNDIEPTVKKLKELCVDDYFVFKSINWEPKGQRISSLIKKMGLRPINCLFIDDNLVNLNEAAYYSSELKIATPDILQNISEQLSKLPKNDLEHKRLHNYKVLEKKVEAQENASDNIAFLFDSNTNVTIHSDCLNNIERIFELIQRTNQLNFTKNRCSLEDLKQLISDEHVNSGYVTVRDRFGDYGIVGFFAIKDNKLIHFLFSCRTIGQGVEQFVYAKIGYPELKTVGEVVNQVTLDEAPLWINQSNNESPIVSSTNSSKVLFKGGCDLTNMSVYLNTSNVIEEFTYIGCSRNNNIEHHNHTTNILTLPFLSKDEQIKYIDEYIFADEEMFSTHLFDKDLAIAFIGTMIEPNLGIYQNRATGCRIAFGEANHPLTDESEWDNYINNKIFTADNKFTKEWLQKFSNTHDFVGSLSPEDILNEYKRILSLMSPSAYLCLLLGSETPFIKESNPNYFGREIIYKQINTLLRHWAEENPRVLIIDFNNFIHGQEDFTNNINHFERRIYFAAANIANQYISSITGTKLEQKSKLYLWIKTQIDHLGNTGFFQSKFYSIAKIPYYKIKNYIMAITQKH